MLLRLYHTRYTEQIETAEAEAILSRWQCDQSLSDRSAHPTAERMPTRPVSTLAFDCVDALFATRRGLL
jgi:hypothetical protein